MQVVVLWDSVVSASVFALTAAWDCGGCNDNGWVG